MFDLKRLHIGKPSRAVTPAPAGKIPSPSEPVKLVAITQDPEDSGALQKVARTYGWTVSIVGSSAAAMPLLNAQPTPLAICDRDLSAEDWRDVLVKIAAQPQAVCVLLASRVVDDYLWHQVIRYHGYDVVAKPFQPEELRRAVTFAWSWRGWARRHYTDALRKPTAG